jgi:hypothetical protein
MQAIALLLISHFAHATPNAPKSYILDMQLSQNGKLVTSPKISALEDEKVQVTEGTDKEQTFVEVVAREEKAGQVAMEFEVGTINAKGKRTVTARPKIIANEGQTASITDTVKGNETTITVTARPQSL